MSAENLIDARPLVAALLTEALALRASDIHVDPEAEGTAVRLRVDGLLQPYATHTPEAGRAIVARLMVLANLLTYRLDIPQEGRINWSAEGRVLSAESGNAGQGSGLISGLGTPNLDLRLSVMPTTHGLRAAVRLPADLLQPKTLAALDLPETVLAGLRRFAASDGGMLILTGPAGSGKTTTIYALLQHIQEISAQGLSIVTLEDPVERDLPGVTQIEITPHGQLTYERALRSILRQDPQVLMLGEIRDAATASLAVQAALSGHRLICTLHAGHPAGAIARLFEMGLEPYQITSALFAVVAQRLLRKVRAPGAPAVAGDAALGRYAGRVPAAEMAVIDAAMRAAILRRADAAELQALLAARPGYRTLRQAAEELAARGRTDAEELARVFGPAVP